MEMLRLVRVTLCCLAVLVLHLGTAQAFWLDKDKTISLKGKLQTRVSISTEETKGYTNSFFENPSDSVDSGELVQHRNLAYVEFNHDLKNISIPGIKLKYHLLGRFLYDGVYDYGADEYQYVKDENESEIKDFQKDAELWEAYLDISKGPLFLRIGRQSMAWGETDLFRLLDNVNPLDNTYGGIFEDLDDRRIPLDMLRVNYDFGDVGPISNFSLEGYWVPGFIEDTVAPFAPNGTRYSMPLPDYEFFLTPPIGPFAAFRREFVTPDKEMSESRFGARAIGIIADNFNYTLAFMRTITDTPAIEISLNPATMLLSQNLIYDTQDILGASLNFYESHLDMIFRMEGAWFIDEPVFIPGVNLGPLVGAGLTGEIPEKDIYRFMIGFDKYQWIRALNKTQTFTLLFQYFGAYIDDYEDGISQPVELFPSLNGYQSVKRLEQTFVAVVTTTYNHGKVEPLLEMAYDPRGTWLVQPSVNFKFDPWRLKFQYSNISGKQTAFGHFKDRDQMTMVLTLMF